MELYVKTIQKITIQIELQLIEEFEMLTIWKLCQVRIYYRTDSTIIKSETGSLFTECPSSAERYACIKIAQQIEICTSQGLKSAEDAGALRMLYARDIYLSACYGRAKCKGNIFHWLAMSDIRTLVCTYLTAFYLFPVVIVNFRDKTIKTHLTENWRKRRLI